MEQRQIFRKANLERLASPEQLDLLTTFAAPSGWLALLVCGLLLVMALACLWFDNLPSGGNDSVPDERSPHGAAAASRVSSTSSGTGAELRASSEPVEPAGR